MKRILLFAVLLMVQLGFGQSPYTSVGSGNWNSDATWSGTGVPGVGDVVNIANGHAVTVTANAAAASVTFTGASATLAVNTGMTLIISNTLTLNSLVNSNSTSTISGLGTITTTNLTIGSDVASTSNGTYTSSLNSTISSFNVTNNVNLLSYVGTSTNRRNNAVFNLQSGVVDVDGQITSTNENSINASTFSMVSNPQTGLLLLGFNGNPFSLSGTGTNTINLNGSSSTVNYDGTAQTVGIYTYNNLTLSGSWIKTFNATTTVNGNLSIASGIITNLGTFTHTAKTLTLGGSTTPSGFWGSTTSSATNKNNTYFADTTGIVNVGSSTCTSPTVYTMTGSGNLCTGSAGNIIGLSNSEIGVSYQLVRNSVNVGSVIAGTGSSISFGLQNSVGDYTVIATRNNTFCSMIMTGVVTITIASLPPLPVGATIVDASCNASVGSITLANQNHALEFVKTSSQYVRTVTPFLSNLNSFTIEGWIKYKTSDLNTTGFTSLFGQNDVLEFGFQDSRLHLYTLNGGYIYAIPPVSLGDNTWHHVAAVGTGSQILIYVDGVEVGSGGNMTSNYGASTFNVNIGAGVFNATGGFFGGQIMKVGFYNTALSAARIASLAYSPIFYSGIEPGLIAGYNFQEGSGTTLASLPVGKNGILENTPIWRDPYTYAWAKTGTPAYTAATRDIVGLSPGEYNLNFDIGKGCPRPISYTIGTKSTTWNGTSWTPSLPTMDHNIEFTGSYTSNGDINVCSCTVTSGHVLIKAGHTLTITNAVNVTNNATTSLVFENNASLVQTTNVTNTGA
ncbi:LamG-like jellyroll fold domain-containing protein, partial [Flavobacterium succinicans]|uniref:LamG-like jellyroll fold domain-containing protein n=1 Tax=Flavobacterium succinicans TaxID=29536 RepID=UPI0012FB4F6D